MTESETTKIEKIRPRYIILERIEGIAHAELRVPHVCRSFLAADKWLRTEAVTAPKGGNSDKVEFDILYQDGSNYRGVYPLEHIDIQVQHNLANHIRVASGADPEYADLLEKYVVGD